ncbi:hypothetical protein RJ640_026138, partial [Escallonia rubra]
MAIDSGLQELTHKLHRSRRSGPTAKKKAKSDKKKRNVTDEEKKQNPKAFAFSSTVKAKRLQSRASEKEQRRLHVPTIDRSTGEPAPFVGKSLLIKSLVKHYTKHNLPEVRGPITIVSGKQRRLQFVECPNDINGMIDAAKYADLALLLIDGSYGFEMGVSVAKMMSDRVMIMVLTVVFHETFEFLNILQVHGFPKVMGVLTHLDKFKDVKKLKKTKQRLKHRFWTEIYDGAKLFYLSGLIHGKYHKREIHNLARFISVMKFHTLSWRVSHPYILVDRFEDVTPPEKVEANSKCDRNVTLYGYLRGCNLKRGSKLSSDIDYLKKWPRRIGVFSGALMDDVRARMEFAFRRVIDIQDNWDTFGFNIYMHIAGVGDYNVAGITGLADPCPLPSAAKKKGLRDKEKLFYAPMSGLGDLLYDKDAIYININDHFVQFSKVDDEDGGATRKGKDRDVGEDMVKSLQNTRYSIDQKLENSFITLFSKKGSRVSEDPRDAKDAQESLSQVSSIHPMEQSQSGDELRTDGPGEESDDEDMDGLESSDEDDTRQKDLTASTIDNSSGEENNNGTEQLSKGNLKEHIEFHGGRTRRKAIFGNDIDRNNLK